MKEYLLFLKTFEKAVLNAQRDIDEIELIAVSKKKPIELIREVINSGFKSFGENQLQEVENKWIELQQDYSNTRLHFIGNIQSKKTEKIFELCDVIHSVDREKIVQKLKNCETETNLKKNILSKLILAMNLKKLASILMSLRSLLISALGNMG